VIAPETGPLGDRGIRFSKRDVTRWRRRQANFASFKTLMNQLVRMSQIGEADAIAEPSADLRVPFAQSGAFVCKFIIGEPSDQAVCCGASVPDGKSWCAFHRRIVFEPARPGRIR